MTSTNCSEWTLTPWATTDASRQCDTVQSVGTGDLLTMYMAVAVVLLLYNIIILAYLVRRGIRERGFMTAEFGLRPPWEG
jgi:preprotein translocase subunit SecG